ncbi:8-oxoguanine DNA glycosylase OGG fold protein [Arthrobacter dokdonensis]|uniref:8-oxoguanine DNA glycosylase OGG fold protein n=1 Tax=Arthrobacter dokdonellae TaxID=2211210 RepID=UPI003AABB725
MEKRSRGSWIATVRGGKLAGAGLTSVTRKDLFDLGDQIPTVENAVQLFYYSLAWGLGTRAPRLHQRLDGLVAHQEKAGQLLVAAWTLVQDGAPIREAYGTLITNRGAGRIPWFGPAFSTKFLYFAQGGAANPRYVILDQVVSKNLRQDAWPQSPTAGWWPETYERYCGLLERWADHAGERLDGARPVRADEIEITLFRRLRSST